MKLVIASLFALGLVQAHATTATGTKVAQSSIEKLVKPAAQEVRTSAADLNVKGPQACNPDGDTCYPEDSWACCSGLCIDQACH